MSRGEEVNGAGRYLAAMVLVVTDGRTFIEWKVESCAALPTCTPRKGMASRSTFSLATSTFDIRSSRCCGMDRGRQGAHIKVSCVTLIRDSRGATVPLELKYVTLYV